jgi:adenosylhomocysteine nucleosidase
MILVTACFRIEARWIPRRPGVRVVRTAIGERSRETMAGLDTEASLLVATGFCGGIDPRIRRGDLFLARTVRHRGEEIRIDPELLARARSALNGGSGGLHVGLSESVDHVLRPDEKRALAAEGVGAVDMESGPLARWAADRGIPFLSLRVVLDPAETDLPFPADRPFWLSALRRPIAAIRTARVASVAGRTLGTAIDEVAEAFEGGTDA